MSDNLNKEKKNDNIMSNVDINDKITVNDETINLTSEDERPGIGWEITGTGDGNTGD